MWAKWTKYRQSSCAHEIEEIYKGVAQVRTSKGALAVQLLLHVRDSLASRLNSRNQSLAKLKEGMIRYLQTIYLFSL